MMAIEIVGFVAAALSTAAFIPQVYKTWRHKSTKDISLTMDLVLLSGLILWLVYGIYHNSFPIILANGVTAVLVLFVVLLKLKYK
ncbi:SemiSWEET transporter [Arenibacter sp. GZD96]|uniref:SemiSWEET family sugar transporter n=1 Tax=Aurantibrevibacter litoralis TaxID=3106030 RepID=UPI002AFDE760|nr:SemiSWEET transporter [Arenibacter sp. GZD-96]MEA1787177.1 SemiSWEET transporter [Arenibacter sp. GZD-96]